MAHNGGFDELDRLEAQLGDYLDGVEGDTDSERYLALVTQCVDRNGGDVGAGITEAASWLADNVPLSRSISCSRPTPTCGRCATPLGGSWRPANSCTSHLI